MELRKARRHSGLEEHALIAAKFGVRRVFRQIRRCLVVAGKPVAMAQLLGQAPALALSKRLSVR
jgi:hypothetical protein